MVGSSSTTSTVPREGSLTGSILREPRVRGRLTEGQGIAGYPLFRNQAESCGAPPSAGRRGRRGAARRRSPCRRSTSAPATDAGIGPAVQQHAHVPRPTWRAEHHVDAPGAEVEVERATGRRGPVERDPPGAPIGEFVVAAEGPESPKSCRPGDSIGLTNRSARAAPRYVSGVVTPTDGAMPWTLEPLTRGACPGFPRAGRESPALSRRRSPRRSGRSEPGPARR